MARILVVDDEEPIRIMLRTCLERDGYQVMDAPDGKVGMALCHEEPFDLVVTDIVMPVKDGIETMMELHKFFPKTKIIAISGGGQKINANEVLRTASILGAQYTLFKPFNLKNFLSMVRGALCSDNK